MRTLLLLACLALPGYCDFAVQYRGFLQTPSGRGWEVIRSQAEYEAFVARIPRHKLAKKLPAPPSTDPLLALPPVDFGQNALIAVWSNSVHIEAVINEVQRKGEDVELDLSFDAPTDPRYFQTPSGYGAYHAVLVPTFPGKVLLGQIRKKAPRPLPAEESGEAEKP